MPSIHDRLLRVASTISPALSDAIEVNGPIRLKRAQGEETLSLRLCRAVTGQQLSVLAARSIWNRLMDLCGERPLLEVLATTSPEALRGCGLSGAKVKTMQAIARADHAGLLDGPALADLEAAERTARLTAIWGVGQWTADMMGISFFRDPDIWPDGDVTARKTLIRLTSARRKTHLTAARFSPYRSYLALHMWRWSDANPTA